MIESDWMAGRPCSSCTLRSRSSRRKPTAAPQTCAASTRKRSPPAILLCWVRHGPIYNIPFRFRVVKQRPEHSGSSRINTSAFKACVMDLRPCPECLKVVSHVPHFDNPRTGCAAFLSLSNISDSVCSSSIPHSRLPRIDDA